MSESRNLSREVGRLPADLQRQLSRLPLGCLFRDAASWDHASTNVMVSASNQTSYAEVHRQLAAPAYPELLRRIRHPLRDRTSALAAATHWAMRSSAKEFERGKA